MCPVRRPSPRAVQTPNAKVPPPQGQQRVADAAQRKTRLIHLPMRFDLLFFCYLFDFSEKKLGSLLFFI
jgi:hypothetical protein